MKQLAAALLLSILPLTGCAPSVESARSAATVATTSAPAAATTARSTLNFTDEADDAFLAALPAKGVSVDDPDALIAAGNGVCLMIAREDADLIEAAAWVMDSFDVTGDEAGDIATTAINVYCPGER